MDYRAWCYSALNGEYPLKLQTLRSQELTPHQVRVAVKAASLNYRDLIAWRNKAGRNIDGKIACSDGAGEVVEVGTEVTQWKVGDRVAGCFFQTWQKGRFEMRHHKNDLGGTLHGMLSESVTLPEDGLVRIPDHLSYDEGATLPCAALTAWYALVERGGLTINDSVLVLGTGGVSIFALQIAHAMGCRVFVTSSSNEKLTRAKQLGAIQTINYTTHADWDKEIMNLTNQEGVDHVVETGGPGTLQRSMNSVAAGGQIALIGVLTGFGPPEASMFPLLARNVRMDGIYVGSRNAFQSMNAFLSHHNIHPIIDRVFGFEQATEAFEYLESGKHFGKVVINCN